MCLIITGKSESIRNTLINTQGMLQDIYNSNPDGIGIMYATTKGLKVVKTLPKHYGDALAFIRKLPMDDRELAIHFRWTTHGHTNMENCHPYDVMPGYVSMMHNGVLHTGNKADTAKSDTWHFIKDYLSDAVRMAPNLVHDAGFLTMVAEFIGDNRFVFMDGEGRMSHVNYDQGVEHDGLWFSNTYAWTPSMLIPNYQRGNKYSNHYLNSSYNLNGYDDTDEDYAWAMGGSKPVSAHHAAYNEADYEWEDEDGERIAPPSIDALGEYVFNADVDALEACFEMMPITTINTLLGNFKASTTKFTGEQDLSSYEADIYRALLDDDCAAMHDFLRDGRAAGIVAEVICYYLNWDHKPAKSIILPALLA